MFVSKRPRALVLVCALVSLQIRKKKKEQEQKVLYNIYFNLKKKLEENDREQTQSLFHFQA